MVDFLHPRYKSRRDLPINDIVTDDELKAAIAPIIVGGLTNGLLDPSDTFTLTALTDTSLRVGAITAAYFESLVPTGTPFKSFAQQDIALNTIPGLAIDGIYIRYVIITDAGAIEFFDAAVTQDDTRITLGIVFLTKSGATVSFINGAAGPLNVFNKPMLSDVSSYDRASHALSVDIEFAPNASLTMRNSAGTLVSESVNWHGVGNIHQRPIPANNPMQFRLVHAGLGSLPSPPGITTAIDPTQYWNGTALTTLSNPNAASVQRIFVTLFGTITVQYGEIEYSNVADAVASINVAPFTDVFPSGYFIEIARVALRRSTTNLQNTNDAVFALKDGSVSGAGEIITASNRGAGQGVFAAKVSSDLQFKSLIAGTNITLTADANGITIAATGSIGITVEWADVLNKPASITSIAALTPAADRLAYFTGASTAALTTLTSFARTLLDDVDASSMRLTLGLGTAATATLTTSNLDTTVGRVLKVPDFGIGNVSTMANVADLNTITAGGLYSFTTGATNAPGSFPGELLHINTNANSATQIASDRNTNRVYSRCKASGVWSGWNTGYSTGNVSAYIQTLLDDLDAATARTTLGLANGATTTISTFMLTMMDDVDAATARGTIGAQQADATLTAFAALTIAANVLPYGTGTDTFATTPFTAFARTLLDDADNTAARTTLGLGNLSTATASAFFLTLLDDIDAAAFRTSLGLLSGATTAISTYGATLVDDVDATAARTTLGLSSGATTPISAFGATLVDDIDAAAARTTLGLQNGATTTISAFALTILDDTSAAAVRTTLELGTAAQADTADFVTTAANIGTGADVFESKTGSTLNFRSLVQGSNITIIETATEITISASGEIVNSVDWVDVFNKPASIDALASTTSAANTLPYYTGVGTASTTPLTAFGRSLIDDADATAGRATLSVYSIAQVDSALAGKQASDATLTAFAGLTIATNVLPYGTGTDTFATTPFTAFARTILDDVDGPAVRTTIGAQALDATLTAIAGAATGANILHYFSGTDTVATTTLSSYGRSLIDDADATAARTTLGLANGATTTISAFGATLVDDADAVTARGTLEVYSTTEVDTQIGGRQPLDATLTAFAGLTITANTLPYGNGADTFATTPLTAFGRSLIDDADNTAARTTLGLANGATTTISAYALTLVDDVDASAARTTLGLANGATTTISAFALTILDDADAAAVRTTIGAQASDATLTAFAGLTIAANTLPYGTGTDTFSTTPLTAFGRSLIDDADNIAARTTLGLANGATTTISAFALTLVDDADAATARGTLGCGTAATGTLTTSTLDGTIGRVSRVGDFSLGGPAVGIGEAAISSEQPTAIYNVIQAALGVLPINQNGYLDHIDNASAGFARQEYSSVAENRKFMRTQISGTYSGWVEYWTTGNLPVTTYAKTLLDDADAATARGTLGLGTAAVATAFSSSAPNENLSNEFSVPYYTTLKWFYSAASEVTGNTNWNNHVYPGVSSRLMNSSDTNGPGYTDYSFCRNITFGAVDGSFSLHQEAVGYDVGGTGNNLRKAWRLRLGASSWTPWVEAIVINHGNNQCIVPKPVIFAADRAGTTLPLQVQVNTSSLVGGLGIMNGGTNLGYLANVSGAGVIDLQANFSDLRMLSSGALRGTWNTSGLSVVGTVSATSDKKFKKKGKKVKGSLARIMALKAKDYFFTILGKQQLGFYAQDVQKIYPNSVMRVKGDGRKSHLVMSKDEIITDLVAVVQEQELRLQKLEKLVHDLTR